MKNMELAKGIGHRIKVVRVANKLTQAELGGKLGFSSQYLSEIEHGKKLISISNLVQLCLELNVPLAYFDPREPNPEERF